MEGRSPGLRTQVPCDKFDGNDIAWEPQLYTIDEIITEFPLPVLVKVEDGYMINELECLETNTILSIHGYRRMEKFTAIDQRERRLSIPVSCKRKVVVRPNFTIPLSPTIADVCGQPKVPKYITNGLEFESDNRIFPASTTFSMKSVDKTVPRVLCSTQTEGEIALSASTTGDFRETVHPDDRNKLHLMKDLVGRQLPLAVEFQQHGTEETVYGLRMGTVRLKDLIITDVVYATHYEDGRRKLITFSRGLKIKLKMGHIIVEADDDTYSTIAEPKEDKIDEELLENILHLDPYNGDYTIVEYGSALQKLRDRKNDSPVCIEDPAFSTNSKVRQSVRATTAEPPSCPKRSPKKPPRIPPRTKYPNEKSSHSFPDKFEAISKLNTAVKNRYVPTPKAPPKLPPKSPIKQYTTATPPDLPCDMQPPLNQATSIGNPQNMKISERPPLPVPRHEGVSTCTGVDKLQFDKKWKRSQIPVDTNLMAKSKEAADLNEVYEEIPAQKAQFPADETLSAMTSGEVKEPGEDYEKVTYHKTLIKQDSSLGVQKSQRAQPPCHAYEDVELPTEKLPVDTSLMTSKLQVAKKPGKAYQDLVLPTEKLPVDTTSMPSKLQVAKKPGKAYQDLVLPTEKLPVDTTSMPSKLQVAKKPRKAYQDLVLPTEKLPIDTTSMPSKLRVAKNPIAPPKGYTEQKWETSNTVWSGAKKSDRIELASSKTETSNEFDDFIKERIASAEENMEQPGYKIYDFGKREAPADKGSAQENSQKCAAEAAEAQDDPIIKELTGKDVDGICDVLQRLQLGDFRSDFIDHQMDGELLSGITEEELVSELGMTLFQAKKLCLYMKGWKPDDERDDCSSQESEEAQPNGSVDTWLVSDVSRRMMSIKLNSFAEFCKENQVNGSLLAKLLDDDVLDSVRKDHNVSLSKIEQRKLTIYVRKGWRPKSIQPEYKIYDFGKREAPADKGSAQENSQKCAAEAAEAQVDPIIKELTGNDEDGVCDVLQRLQLGDFRSDFIDYQMDGELLSGITEEELVSELGMTLFQAKKLCLYMKGWKPDDELKERDDCSSQESEEAQSNDSVDTWLVSDVSRRMMSIKLNSFAEFCKENQVNGSLLAKLLDDDVLDSVRKDHNVSLSKIEQRKLTIYVRKGWRPKSIS